MVIKKSGKVDKFQPSGDVRRVQALGLGWKDPSHGRWVRIGSNTGKWRQYSVEKEHDKIVALLACIANEAPEVAQRIGAELFDLCERSFPVDFYVSQAPDTIA